MTCSTTGIQNLLRCVWIQADQWYLSIMSILQLFCVLISHNLLPFYNKCPFTSLPYTHQCHPVSLLGFWAASHIRLSTRFTSLWGTCAKVESLQQANVLNRPHNYTVTVLTDKNIKIKAARHCMAYIVLWKSLRQSRKIMLIVNQYLTELLN